MSPLPRDLRRFLTGACLVLGLLFAGPGHQLVHLHGHGCGSAHGNSSAQGHCGDRGESSSEEGSSAREGASRDLVVESLATESECVLCHLGLDTLPRPVLLPACLEPAAQPSGIVPEAVRSFDPGRSPPARGPPSLV